MSRPIAHARDAAAQDAAKTTIMVVDDDDDIREGLVALLAACGYATLAARNGAEALAALARVRPGLILADWHMPIMGGGDLLLAMRTSREWTEIPVFIVTALWDLHGGIEDAVVFAKPVDVDCLLAAIRQAVD